MDILTQAIALLVENRELIELVIGAVKGGTPKEAIAKAIELAKIKASDEAFKEELGIR